MAHPRLPERHPGDKATAAEWEALRRAAGRRVTGPGVSESADGWTILPPTPRGGDAWVWAQVTQAPVMTGTTIFCKLVAFPGEPPDPLAEELEVKCITITPDGFWLEVAHVYHAPFLALDEYIRLTKTSGEVTIEGDEAKDVWYVADDFIDISLLPPRYCKIKAVGTNTFTANLVDTTGAIIPEITYPAITVQVMAIDKNAAGVYQHITLPVLSTALPWIKADQYVRVYNRVGYRPGWWLAAEQFTTCA